jgi:hypothetical protein
VLGLAVFVGVDQNKKRAVQTTKVSPKKRAQEAQEVQQAVQEVDLAVSSKQQVASSRYIPHITREGRDVHHVHVQQHLQATTTNNQQQPTGNPDQRPPAF